MSSEVKITTGTCVAILLVLASAIFVINNTILEGSLMSREMLSVEIHAPADSLQLYRISETPPFHYRALFPGIVKGTMVMLGTPDSDTFFVVYRVWSWLFFISATVLFFFLMRSAGFDRGLSLAGAIVFLTLPPMLFAYTLPVHTREDTLAYSLLFLGLIFIVKEKPLPVFVISIIGIFCRETLLILPLFYFIFSRSPIFIRLAILGLCGATFLTWRLILWEQYFAWAGLRWNIANPAQVVGFLFLTFNVLWYPVVLLPFSQSRMRATATAEQEFFLRSAPAALIIIIVTTYVGGIFNEIRLLYLAAPWVIIVAARFWITFRDEILRAVKTPGFALIAVATLTGCALAAFYILQNMNALVARGRHPVPYELWVVAGAVYMALTLLFTPTVIRITMGIFKRP